MIKPQHFALLAAATAASVVVAAGLYSATNRWSAGKVEGAQLLPGFGRNEKTLKSVEITQGEKKLTLERAGELWTIKERAGYPANAERVKALLNTLAKAELIEAKTASKDRHSQLELEDPAGKDAKSRGVRVLDDKGRALAEVVLGKSRYDAFGQGKGGVYVRRLAEAQTWLATGDPKGAADLRDWVSTTAFETDWAKLTKLSLEHPGEEPLLIEKSDGKEKADPKEKDQKFRIAQMPDGKKLKQGVTIDQIAQGFGSMEFEDVRRLEATPSGDKVSILKLADEAGLGVTFRLRKEGELNWLSFTAIGEGDAKKTADEINARGTGWEFRIPQWKADQIGKRRADLFETS